MDKEKEEGWVDGMTSFCYESAKGVFNFSLSSNPLRCKSAFAPVFRVFRLNGRLFLEKAHTHFEKKEKKKETAKGKTTHTPSALSQQPYSEPVSVQHTPH